MIIIIINKYIIIRERKPENTYNSRVRNSTKRVNLPQKNSERPHIRFVWKFLKGKTNDSQTIFTKAGIFNQIMMLNSQPNTLFLISDENNKNT